MHQHLFDSCAGKQYEMSVLFELDECRPSPSSTTFAPRGYRAIWSDVER